MATAADFVATGEVLPSPFALAADPGIGRFLQRRPSDLSLYRRSFLEPLGLGRVEAHMALWH